MPQIPESLNRNLLENHTFFAFYRSFRDVRFSLLSDLGPVLLPSQETDHSPSHFCVQHDDVFGAPVLAGRASPDEGQHSVMGGLGS